MLIVEGSDMVGKTVLVNKLCKVLTEMGHSIIPQHFGLLPDTWDYYWDYLKFMNQRVIMDRFILSEVVYGEILREGSMITTEIYRMLDAHLRLNASVTAVIIGEETWYEKHISKIYDQRCEMFSVEQNIAVNSGFRDIARLGIDVNKLAISYAPDIDLIWTVSDKNGFPDDEFIAKIIKLYAERMAKWEVLYG